MSAHFNGLSPAEVERLAFLSEEMGEAQQAIGKILRHGFNSTNPCKPDSISNRGDLWRETGHVLAAIDMMETAGDLEDLEFHKEQKLRSVKQWMHHQ